MGLRRDPDEEPDIDEDEEEESERRRPSRRHRHRSGRSGRPTPVRRWRSGREDEEEEEHLPGVPGKKPIFWRARDSLYFEPLIAVAIIVLILVGLFAYTQNWPPVYVVESDSMQHGSNDVLGLINTGDLVLAQKTSTSSIVPYFAGMQTGYSTYGEYGDVILYHPNGQAGTPVIHRALLYLDWNGTTGSYSAPELAGLPCGNPATAAYATPGTPATPGSPANCGTTNLAGTLDLFRIGWMSVNVSLSLGTADLGDHSGFLTMGDKNFVCSGPGDCIGLPDQGGSSPVAISSLVEPGWVIGVARGMIPWFGAVKLLLDGQASMVPPQSWEFLGLTIVGVILAAFGIHYALRAEGIETPLRKEEEEEERAAEEEDEDEEEDRARRWLRALRPWHREEEEEDEEEEEVTPRRRTKSSSKSAPARGRRGRPRPQVRRSEKARKHRGNDDHL
jgi:signal peptidase